MTDPLTGSERKRATNFINRASGLIVTHKRLLHADRTGAMRAMLSAERHSMALRDMGDKDEGVVYLNAALYIAWMAMEDSIKGT